MVFVSRVIDPALMLSATLGGRAALDVTTLETPNGSLNCLVEDAIENIDLATAARGALDAHRTIALRAGPLTSARQYMECLPVSATPHS